MKVGCPAHGAHFGDEVGDITACTFFWSQFKLDKLPLTAKQDLAEWLVQIPADKIFIETGWGINFHLLGQYIGYENSLAESLPGYQEATEEQRREWQRNQVKLAYQRPEGRLSRWLKKLRF